MKELNSLLIVTILIMGSLEADVLGELDTEVEGLLDGLFEAEVEGLEETEVEGELDADVEGDELGDGLELGELLGELLAEVEGEFEVEALGEFDTEVDGEVLGEDEADDPDAGLNTIAKAPIFTFPVQLWVMVFAPAGLIAAAVSDTACPPASAARRIVSPVLEVCVFVPSLSFENMNIHDPSVAVVIGPVEIVATALPVEVSDVPSNGSA